MKITCSGCGANVTFLPNKQKCYCEYCGIEINNITAKKIDSVINFEVSERDAIAKFQKKLKIKNDDMKNNKILSVSKVFIPYFLYEYSLNILHSGKCYVRHVGLVDYLRGYNANVAQLQCNVSSSENIGDFKISQYDFSKIKSFERNDIKNEYIVKSAETYQIFNDESKENLLNSVRRALTGIESIKSDSDGYELRIKNFKHRLILLPVYFLRLQKNNLIRNYTMNGQTGEVIEGNKRKSTANFKLFVPFFIWIIILSIIFYFSVVFYKNIIANIICVITTILFILSFTLIGSIMKKNYLKNVNADFIENVQLNNFKKQFYKRNNSLRKKVEKLYGKKIYLEEKLIYIQQKEK